MEIKIHCFGIARQIVGGASFLLTVPEAATVAQLRSGLVSAYPEFGELSDFAIARNEAYATPEEVVTSTDEIVIIPPVSGG